MFSDDLLNAGVHDERVRSGDIDILHRPVGITSIIPNAIQSTQEHMMGSSQLSTHRPLSRAAVTTRGLPIIKRNGVVLHCNHDQHHVLCCPSHSLE